MIQRVLNHRHFIILSQVEIAARKENLPILNYINVHDKIKKKKGVLPLLFSREISKIERQAERLTNRFVSYKTALLSWKSTLIFSKIIIIRILYCVYTLCLNFFILTMKSLIL